MLWLRCKCFNCGVQSDVWKALSKVMRLYFLVLLKKIWGARTVAYQANPPPQAPTFHTGIGA